MSFDSVPVVKIPEQADLLLIRWKIFAIKKAIDMLTKFMINIDHKKNFTDQLIDFKSQSLEQPNSGKLEVFSTVTKRIFFSLKQHTNKENSIDKKKLINQINIIISTFGDKPRFNQFLADKGIETKEMDKMTIEQLEETINILANFGN